MALLVSCKPKPAIESNQKFQLTYQGIIVDTPISTIKFLNQHFFFWDEKKKLIAYSLDLILDTAAANQLQLLDQDSLLNQFESSYVTEDSIVDKQFGNKAIYDDSAYRIYFTYPMCTVDGEESSYGATFFYHKHTRKWFYFPTVMISQVFKTHLGYILSTQHISYLVKNPEKIIEVEDQIQFGVCYPYLYVSKTKSFEKLYPPNYYISKINKKYANEVPILEIPFEITALNFMVQDTLFALQLSNPNAYIGKYINNRFELVDSFNDNTVPKSNHASGLAISRDNHCVNFSHFNGYSESDITKPPTLQTDNVIIDVQGKNIRIVQVKRRH